MATCEDWNNAIADFFAQAAPKGGAFYLSVDEDALTEIADSGRIRVVDSDPVTDFEMAVRRRYAPLGSVRLPPRSPMNGQPPGCLAFLSAMSLAAHRMAPEEGIADINYFTRLREVFGLPTNERGRPWGLQPAGSEERLWAELNRWALDNGWQPSAERGTSEPTKYINYPLSQALLREGDKGKLERAFRSAESTLGRYADRERVGSWFFNNDAGFSTKHISNLAKEVGAERFESVVNAVYDVYASIDWDSDFSETITRRTRSNVLSAGLYREANPLFGSVSYFLYPRRHSQNISGLSAIRNGESVPLHQDSDGSFLPLWEVDPAGDDTCELVGNSAVSTMRLPPRDFWILTRDRFDDGSGNFASRGSPQLGETFILLCRNSLVGQMNILREEGLVNWDGEPIPVDTPQSEGWVEFLECMVLSASWSGVISRIPDLFDELRPQSRASISLQGGLKTGRRDSWLKGHQPSITVASFKTCQVRVSSVSDPGGKPEFDGSIAPNSEPIKLSALNPGDYWIEVLVNGIRAASRSIKIVSWDSLAPANPTNAYGVRVGDSILRGALLTPMETRDAERS